ncbi:hypothetical protein [Mycobacterium sp. 141]|nr:hypothetical protein [Mycobacterium sp. 141]
MVPQHRRVAYLDVCSPLNTPYGRLAAVADLTGAAFNLSSLQD